jgi:hypothetical protein
MQVTYRLVQAGDNASAESFIADPVGIADHAGVARFVATMGDGWSLAASPDADTHLEITVPQEFDRGAARWEWSRHVRGLGTSAELTCVTPGS